MNKKETDAQYVNRFDMFLKVCYAERGIDFKFIDCRFKDIKKEVNYKMETIKEREQCS